jgi:hypothetical protein
LRKPGDPNAPRCLSCLYLVENNDDGRMVLRSMFLEVFNNPMIIEVGILNDLELKRFDSFWVDKYFDEPKQEYLENYWTATIFNEREPSWEYLLEGTIIMKNASEIREVDDHVSRYFPEIYDDIQKAR